MANNDIRQMAKEYGFKLWQVADELGMTDVAFSKMLRKELSQGEKQRIRHAIDERFYKLNGYYYDNDF